jgi:hypothetical protein
MPPAARQCDCRRRCSASRRAGFCSPRRRQACRSRDRRDGRRGARGFASRRPRAEARQSRRRSRDDRFRTDRSGDRGQSCLSHGDGARVAKPSTRCSLRRIGLASRAACGCRLELMIWRSPRQPQCLGDVGDRVVRIGARCKDSAADRHRLRAPGTAARRLRSIDLNQANRLLALRWAPEHNVQTVDQTDGGA